MHEISLHILDIVENSTNAGADKVNLFIDEDSQKDEFRLTISDNGKGMDANSVARVTDPFVTSRTTRKVGLGLPLLEMTTKMCDGRMSVESEPGRGTTVTASWRLTHLDRPPLGNLVGTLKTIIVLNPQLLLRYCHKVDGRALSFDTLEFQAAMGELSFSQPEVIEWLDQFLRSNLSILYGGKEE